MGVPVTEGVVAWVPVLVEESDRLGVSDVDGEPEDDGVAVSEAVCDAERLGEDVGDALCVWDAVPVRLGEADTDGDAVCDAVPLALGVPDPLDVKEPVPEPLGDRVTVPVPDGVPELLGVPLGLGVTEGVGEQTDLTAVRETPGNTPRDDQACPTPGDNIDAVAKPRGPTGGTSELLAGAAT